ncbi:MULTISPECIES: trypsin-like peptidase domain-containing protein [unclassified Streptomyces]|uniref:trypsin-like peptidase domain-containing protein n=1 Tax=unclassified Streptomyces TaxID=2593676 RepID=UPI0036598E79
MSPIDAGRVAEVIVGRGTAYGSGYRISSRLVLTVAHLFKTTPNGAGTRSNNDSDNGRGIDCTVRLGGGTTDLPATSVWHSAGHDLALVRLDEVTDKVPPVAFGSLRPGVGRIPFTAIGFPAFAERPASVGVQGLLRRDNRQVDGFIQLGSNLKSGLLDLSFTTSPPLASKPDPWKGISGAALFVQNGALLVGVQASRLPAGGTSSAEAEPIAEALKDQEFVDHLVMNGVRPHPVLVDPPGQMSRTLLRAVIPQEELIEGFGDFKKNLTPERLPFVSPGTHHLAEPQNLFRRLVTSAERGVLLVGAAGTGKTRTSMEVGRRALDAGWRVLHVLPGEDASITDQIAEQVFAEASAVLVVVDYLNESLLDLPALRHRLIPEAHRRGVSVALLASVRPGWLQKADRALLHELFDEVELRQDDEFQRMVTDKALATIAPTAIHQLGMGRMLEVCGHRPIVALLIAREVERRVVEGHSVPEAAGLRSGGELPGWLERRLREDGLTVAGREDTFRPARASSALVAAAAAAAACPQPRTEVIAAAHAALSRATGQVEEAAADIVATLLALGWLEPDNGVLAVAHDVVADQLMESVILPERDSVPDLSGTDAMLAGCLTNPRTVGRFAVNVGRLVNDLALAGRAGPVTPVLDSWFARHAPDIGRVMRSDADVGSYALGAICSGPPWSTAAVRSWQEVVTPWLTDFGTGLNARHLLYRGLRHLTGDGALLLVPTALAWLNRHGLSLNASFVLNPLLSRPDLTPHDVQRTVTTALTWLTAHSTTVEAQFVLNPLLARADLTPDDAQQVVTTALTWLAGYGTTAEARFVFHPLASRADLTPDDARQTVTTALTWLAGYGTVSYTPFVLAPLLARADLTPDEAERTVTTAHTWLDHHGTTVEAQFVFNPLLSRTDLTPDDSQRSVTIALTWLSSHGAITDAQFILAPLLARADLTPHDTQQAITTALTWARAFPSLVNADFLLGALLRLLPWQEIPADMTGLVDTWVTAHVPAQDFTYLSKWILRKRLMSLTIFEALLAWVRTHTDSEDLIPRLASAGPQVRPYITSRESATRWLNSIGSCLDYAERHGPAANMNGALDTLICDLTLQFSTGVAAAWADDYIQRWLALPFSMDPAVFRYHDQVVRRCHALILMGRFDEPEAAALAVRLRKWVTQWKQAERSAETLAFIDEHMPAAPAGDQRPAPGQ